MPHPAFRQRRRLVELGAADAEAIGAGHSFVVFLRDGFPVNVLNPPQAGAGVVHDLLRDREPGRGHHGRDRAGRGVLGVADGLPPAGVETPGDEAERKGLLRRVGYKL